METVAIILGVLSIVKVSLEIIKLIKSKTPSSNEGGES